MFPDAGGTSGEFLQAVLALHLAPPLRPSPISEGTRMITWSHSGPLDGGILCLMAMYVSWMEVGGVVGLPQDPPGPASVFARSIRRSIRKSANYTRILPVGTSQTGAVYILAWSCTGGAIT